MTREYKDHSMDKTDLKLWANALRSGAFQQGTGCLKSTDEDDNDKYCCLGVAAELDLLDRQGEDSDDFDLFCNPVNLPYQTQIKLAQLNDSTAKHHSFNQIADWIEENL